jgi:formylglycine-generating enzyme required for sulfatase activity
MDLLKAGATAELHIYQKGNHGFGTGFTSGTFSDRMPAWSTSSNRVDFFPEANRDAPFRFAQRGRDPVLFLAGSSKSASRALPSAVNDGYGDHVYVPAGSFKMGDNFGDGEARERPVHLVELDAFYIAKYEMSNGEWKKFLNDSGYEDPKFWPGGKSCRRIRTRIGTMPKITAGERRAPTIIRP